MAASDTAPLRKAFAAVMQRLDPFEPSPALAVAVSGGADSIALALLAHEWAVARQGTVQALVVDHGLRRDSADEANVTIARLTHLGIPAKLLRLTTLQHGPRLAERARIMRYQALSEACRRSGLLHLLLGHHAMDQAETLMMRALGRSMNHGLGAMPGVLDTPAVRLLRPLLAFHPGALRRFLQERGVAWVEDPSNRDLQALRPRLRHRAAAYLAGDLAGDDGRDGSRAALDGLVRAAHAAGIARSRDETQTAQELARRVTIRPEGFALLSPGRIGVAALARLIQAIGGAAYGPGLSRIASLAAEPRPATLGGARLLPAGRWGHGLLVIREEAAIAAPAQAEPATVWDGRFRLKGNSGWPDGTTIGKLGNDGARFRSRSGLPSAVLRTLPALRCGKTLAAVPHLQYALDRTWAGANIVFEPRKPVAGSCFMPVGACG